jgi:tRNA pseudouridine38-40 synthase
MAYHGWQLQKQHATIQGELCQAIRKITGEQTIPSGCGRTDAGTHARGFVASFTTASRIPTAAFVHALNGVLPLDIRILSARKVPADFHALQSARSKIYRYQIYCGHVLPPHLAREHFHFPYPLDLGIMRQAAELFVGEHDFASFAARSGGKERTVRRISSCRLKSAGRRLTLTVEGNGFLHHMVRNMVGTLLELGRGLMTLPDFEGLFRCRDRTLAGFTAPARGLILLRVRY